jgi:hypothetical protein
MTSPSASARLAGILLLAGALGVVTWTAGSYLGLAPPEIMGRASAQMVGLGVFFVAARAAVYRTAIARATAAPIMIAATPAIVATINKGAPIR